MDCDRTSRSPRLILDENIDFSSLKILTQHGLNQRCSGVYQSWQAEKTRDDQLMKQRGSDAIAAGRKQMEATSGQDQEWNREVVGGASCSPISVRV
jgi:hypothetical protein